MIDRQMKAAEWVMLISLSLVWGGSFFFNAIAVRELPTLTIVLGRVGIAAIALLLVMRAIKVEMPRNGQVWLAFLGMGLLNNVIPFGLIVWAQGHVASGYAAIINATTPLFAVLVAHFATEDEALSANRLVGVLIGFAGVAVLMGVDAIGESEHHLAAEIALLFAALSYGCTAAFGRRFRRLGVPPLATATGQVIASTLWLTPLVFLIDRPWTLSGPTPAALLAVLAIALLSTAFAYYLYFRILERAGATNLSLVTLLVPVSAIILWILFLDERLSANQFGGILVIAAGLIVIDGRVAAGLRCWWRP